MVLSGLFFASKVKGLLNVASTPSADGGTRTYRYAGQVFFASASRFSAAIDFKEPVDRVVIDLSAAHFWDISAVGELDKAVLKLRRAGRQVEVVGLNEASATMVGRYTARGEPAGH
ncbi:STAS domain protein [compost metagenome]